MTNPLTDLADRGQDAVDTAIRSWVDLVQSTTGRIAPDQLPLPDLREAVDRYFDLVEQALAAQRTFARQWLSGAFAASTAVTEQAQRATRSVTEHAAEGTRAAVDTTADTAAATVTEATTQAAHAADAARDLPDGR